LPRQTLAEGRRKRCRPSVREFAPNLFSPSTPVCYRVPRRTGHRAALREARILWPGPLGVEVESVFMADAAEALVQVGSTQGVEGEVYHVPGIRTTPREFISGVYQAVGMRPRVFAGPTFVLKLAELVSATARGAANFAHLWARPMLLNGAKYMSRFDRVPQTPYQEGITRTVAWHRSVSNSLNGTKKVVTVLR
jgi:hypothetical protein